MRVDQSAGGTVSTIGRTWQGISASPFFFVFLALLCSSTVLAGEMTITAYAGARHEFGGFGASTSGSGSQTAMRLLYNPNELDGRVLRLWVGIGTSAQSARDRYRDVVQRARNEQPDLLVVLGACDNHSSIDYYAGHYAEMIKVMRDGGCRVDATGICNEPDDGRWPSSAAAPLVKAFRQQLNNRGLQDVKIIAPESANVDNTMYDWINNIKNDGEALDGLDAWASHSYNCSVTYKLLEMTEGTGKQYWQTESCVDQFTTQGNTINSKQIGASCGVRILADLNMCVTHWLYFFGPGGSNGTALVDGDTPMLQYYYMRQIANAFDVGAGMRYCLSDKGLPRVEMTWEFLQKPAVAAAVARNPDGSWGVGICNGTGLQNNTSIATFYPSEAYDVTMHVQELENAGDVEFQVYKTNTSMRIQEQQSVTARDGTFEVRLESGDLVCLRSEPDVDVEAGKRARQAQREPFSVVRTLSGDFRIGVPDGLGGSRGRIEIFDLHGRRVMSMPLSEVLVGRPIPAGSYVVKVVSPGAALRVPVVLHR